MGAIQEDDQIIVPLVARSTIARTKKPLKANLVDRHLFRFRTTTARELEPQFSIDQSTDYSYSNFVWLCAGLKISIRNR